MLIRYLLAFSYFGFGFILYNILNQVREQIFHPENETDALKGIIWLSNTPKSNIIALLKQPQELRCFLAIVNLSTMQQRVLPIALPGPDPNSEAIYQCWSEAVTTLNSNLKPIMDIFNFDPAYVTDQGYKYIPERIWHGQITIGDE